MVTLSQTAYAGAADVAVGRPPALSER